MDDVRVWTLPGSCGFDTERRQALLAAWRSKRYRERHEDLVGRLTKIDRKLEALLC